MTKNEICDRKLYLPAEDCTNMDRMDKDLHRYRNILRDLVPPFSRQNLNGTGKSWLCKGFNLPSLSFYIDLKIAVFLPGWRWYTYSCFQTFCSTNSFVFPLSHFSNAHGCGCAFHRRLRAAHTFSLHGHIFPYLFLFLLFFLRVSKT